MRYSDSYAINEINTLFQDSFILVDASISYYYNQDLSVSVFGRNLTDESYANFGTDIPGLFSTEFAVQPGRILGGELRYAFF